MKTVAIGLIRLYQVTVSPDHSLLGRCLFPRGLCRYQVSCSDYTVWAIETYGLAGLPRATRRLISCH